VRRGIVLFTRDLRVHDQPALVAAARSCAEIVPLFVLDDSLLTRLAAPARMQFLLESLEDLDRSLCDLGAPLVVRRGDPVAETIRIACEISAEAVFLSEDVSALAHARETRLRRAAGAARVAVTACPGNTVVAPGDLVPAGSEAYRVFTPYWRRWSTCSLRSPVPAPVRMRPVAGLEPGHLPHPDEIGAAPPAEGAGPKGGERAGLARLEAWLAAGGPKQYRETRDVLACGGSSSLLSPYLHLGCVSPLALARRVASEKRGDVFLRQLCWRDFFHQLLDAYPGLAREDLRPGRGWIEDLEALAAWKEGRTGFPLVDAGMRQLAAEGWLPNRARLVAASFLTKHLVLDWRDGAAHFLELLVDGDVAVNAGNWQWVAGTGADTRPRRFLNPTLQARRHDPKGDYVRRWVAELEGIPGPAVHEPWRLDARSRRGYPLPLVDHDEARVRFLGLVGR
jgi:deoxyribodipyrimidine photo-lyase